jgi:histidyl-tRNA synthetase
MFRHERPQRGRYRQFHQVGAEVLGFGGPDVDAELILLASSLFRELGLSEIRLELNSLGQPAERLAHRAALIVHFEQHLDVLGEEEKRRLHTNPLRILDTKNPAMKSVVESAPQLLSFLGEASMAHFTALRTILDANGLSYTINPRLVRGMDYYNLTVFEFITESLGSQGTLCGGGRYDYLIEQVGGKPSPAVGWGLGIERLLELVREQCEPMTVLSPDAYAIIPDVASLSIAIRVVETLRVAGIAVQMHAGGGEGMGSMKSQLKKADSSGAAYGLIFGGEELALGQVTVKSLRDGVGAQRLEALTSVAQWAHTLQSPH